MGGRRVARDARRNDQVVRTGANRRITPCTRGYHRHPMAQRKLLTAVALALAGAVVTAPIAAAATHVSVAPSIGTPKTGFVIRFRAPGTTGESANDHIHYRVFASGTRGRRCSSSASAAVGPTEKGASVRMTLRPAGRRHVWCAGRFRGRVIEILTMTCGPPLVQIACPAVDVAPITIARFSFRVTSTASEMKAIADIRRSHD